jgi:hypothetical protein
VGWRRPQALIADAAACGGGRSAALPPVAAVHFIRDIIRAAQSRLSLQSSELAGKARAVHGDVPVGREQGETRGDDPVAPTFDTSVAHVARVYDYWLGGKDNYAADRTAGDAVIRVYPSVVTAVRANRAFLTRAVRYLTAEAGIRQFLDIGTGIPTASNTHEVAQSIAPGSRVVYVDNDPVVLAHARALLTSSSAGATGYIDADLRDTDTIIGQAAATLDFARPVAVMLIAVMHLIGDTADPYGIVAKLLTAVPRGSYLALSHLASDIESAAMAESKRQLDPLLYEQRTHRTHAQVERFFDGLDVIEPGVVRVPEWRPDSELEATAPAPLWCGVGRKP